ncbi:MAG: DNA gyrase inhibitor YacG [Desulfobacterales bacterium]|nr:DNA gyrase inhibitor YacG [Desulfobacterales bacterium]
MKITCPICKQDTTWEENPHRPFCSEKCKLIDLGKWAAEDYRVPESETSSQTKKDHPNEQDDQG